MYSDFRNNPRHGPPWPRHRPPPSRTPPNFIIRLRSLSPCSVSFDGVISQCSPPPDHTSISAASSVASVYFREWSHALSFLTNIWSLRLRGVHKLVPRLESKVLVPSDELELNNSLRALFVCHVAELIEGGEVKRWELKAKAKSDEIDDVARKLRRKNNKLGEFGELVEVKKGLMEEKEMVLKRISEFKEGMNCVLQYIQGRECADVAVLRMEEEVDWERVFNVMLREVRRFEDGLPIYACRKEILRCIRQQQVMVLIGETGSGKSTQLVQFLVDSGAAGNEAIVCTQPRKIAAISLADRVKEESSWCYKDNSVICYPTYSSLQRFDTKVIYMTDHCLLQHYMKDRNLSGISCIVIDEAHERSLNTDLLLERIRCLLADIRRSDLRLVIMSATADAKQLSDYFYGCEIFHVMGRNYPVDIRYIPFHNEGSSSGVIAPYVHEVVRVATEIHKTEADGAILAFLTSQMEVDWACEKFISPTAVVLPLHGKLSFEDQCHVFETYHGKRKVIFATNLAETSLTIPGVRYVVDSGMVKESNFDPNTGMNVLEVCRISRSSAQQRAGRAGRTGPGKCFRLYPETDFQLMPLNTQPEIRRVHLGIAVLKILALGLKNVEEFQFVDAPSPKAIDMAIRSLVQLDAIVQKHGFYVLTDEGDELVKLGIEPRLGKIVLSCFRHHLGKEGLVLAAVMTNASSIFCRVGNLDDKLKADCLKVQFCHRNGDLFTLLSVYKEWESVAYGGKNRWCWENSINGKSMRRCQDMVKELEVCLEKELKYIIPTYWCWNPSKSTDHDKTLKKVILSVLAENVAMYSGSARFGYEVALSGQRFQLHPSCSLLAFGEKPSWVVFGEILVTSSQHLVCVTAIDFESLSMLCPPPMFDAAMLQSLQLHVKLISGFSKILLKRFCGKFNRCLSSLVSSIKTTCSDERIQIEVNVDKDEVLLFASPEHMETAFNLVNKALEYEQRYLLSECAEKCLYHCTNGSSPVALFGAGAEINHLELGKRCLSVDVFHSEADTIDDKELLMFLEKYTTGRVCTVHKSTGISQEGDQKEKWGSVTFLNPDAARKAVQLNEVAFRGSPLKILPCQKTFGGDNKSFPFPAIKAKVSWPRRSSRGFGIVKCDINDVNSMINDFSILVIGNQYIRSVISRKSADCIVLSGIGKELSEADVLDVLRSATERKILDFFLVRGDAVEYPPESACEEALLREISSFMPKRNPHSGCFRVQVWKPEPKDAYTRALITFDGRLHLEAAKALEHLEGNVLSGCLPWQKVKCQRLFQSSLSCSASVYFAIKNQLDSLIATYKNFNGAEYILEKNENGSFRVKISANATKTVAELRRPLEQLMNGQIINHASLTVTIRQYLFSGFGINLMKSIQRETGTYIFFDRHSYNIKIFGSSERVAEAQQKLVQFLLDYHESKQLEIHLRGRGLPGDLMKSVVNKFGPDLRGLKEKVPGAEFTLSTRHHVISVHSNKELKQKAEKLILEIAEAKHGFTERRDDEAACLICLCDVEDGYRLGGCKHMFCRLCLVEQFESAMKNMDSFPVCCATCSSPISLTDIRHLLSNEKFEELFRASLASHVASSGGTLRFCPSPDCPSVYLVSDPATSGEPFVCGACYTETCTRCHLEYHPYLSCEKYLEFKEDPDLSLKDWRRGRENVKNCPVCGYTIEKVDGCNHVECKCGRHICWVCLEYHATSDNCYDHLRTVHMAIN